MPKLHALCLASLVGVLMAPAEAEAHLPNLANYQLAETGGQWRLRVSMSTDGMHRVMKLRHPGEELSQLSVEEYEARLVRALEEGIALAFDGEPLELRDPQVGLAHHQSNVDFALSVPVARPARVYAHVDALHEQGHQNNVFRIVTQQVNQYKVLKYENGFEGEFVLREESVAGSESAMQLALALAISVGYRFAMHDEFRLPSTRG